MGGPIIRNLDLADRLRDIERRLTNMEVGTPVDVGQTIFVDWSTGAGINQTIASLTAIDVTNSIQTFTLKRPQTVIFFATATAGVSGGTGYGYVQGDIDGQRTVGQLNGDGPKGYHTASTGFSKRLDKGIHTVKLVAWVTDGATSLLVNEGAVFVWGVLGT